MHRFLRYCYLVAAIAVLALLAGACDDDDGDAEAADDRAAASLPLTIKDSGGAEVTLDARPERIISFSPGATEILFAIGAGDRLVATDEFSDFPEAARSLEKLTYSSPDPESALALDPDLVLMAGQQREQVEQFRALGMTVVYLEEAETVAGVLEKIRLLGKITENEDEAGALATSIQARIDAVTAEFDGVAEGPRVFFELTADLYTVAPNTFVGDLITLAGGSNVAAGSESQFPQLSAEAIVDADPEVILLADAEFGETPETVCARPGWDAISACVSGRVHPVDGDLTSRPGPRIVDGLELIASLLHPDRFP